MLYRLFGMVLVATALACAAPAPSIASALSDGGAADPSAPAAGGAADLAGGDLLTGCSAGHYDCDGNPANGCECPGPGPDLFAPRRYLELITA